VTTSKKVVYGVAKEPYPEEKGANLMKTGKLIATPQ
jgi:hypothetical protein